MGSNQMIEPRFYYATCQVGAEKAVKSELGIECPQLRFAFSRPGFITFKDPDPKSNESISLQKAIFTRQWGEVIGQAKDRESLKELLKLIPENQSVQAFDRDLHVPGDEPDDFVAHSHIHSILKSTGFHAHEMAPVPNIGSWVYDLIWIDQEQVFLGRHRHSKRECGSAGNIPVIPLPKESPSRAYLKIEEAILRFKPEIPLSGSVVEVGCSPGGATTAMSMRGLQVTGIDPKFMADPVYDLPGFEFIQKCARDTNASDLKGKNPDWIVMDMNIAPLEAIDELNHVVTLLRKGNGTKLKLSKGFLTIKLNDWKFASSIPLYLKRLEEIGFRKLQPIQLWSNRQEFFVYAGDFHH
jgi:23S rRNA (cytidine2498-2'-O)-methyltransferase